MFTLDKFMMLLFSSYLIKYEDITSEVTIDVRTNEEYLKRQILKYNVPIICKPEYEFLHRHLFWAEVIILYGMLKNIKLIKPRLIELSNNKKDALVIGCSKGRLRSPTMWIYAKLIGINAKVLKGGIVNINKI